MEQSKSVDQPAGKTGRGVHPQPDYRITLISLITVGCREKSLRRECTFGSDDT